MLFMLPQFIISVNEKSFLFLIIYLHENQDKLVSWNIFFYIPTKPLFMPINQIAMQLLYNINRFVNTWPENTEVGTWTIYNS